MNTRDEEFAQAEELAFPLEADNCKANMYINDITTVTIEKEDCIKRANAAVLLAMDVIGRRKDDRDPIKRNNLVSLNKLVAEGTLEETKILLGWKLDTRSLMISLPDEKYIAWSRSIYEIIDKGRTNHDEIESLVGRLGHVSLIID